MLLHGYSVYDRKALQYHAPWFAVTDGAALRSFADLANDRSTTVGTHPGDYILFRVGAWNDATGELIALPTPEHVSDALPLIRQAAAPLFESRPNGQVKEV